MPYYLKRKHDPDRLTIKLGGFEQRDDFDAALKRVKAPELAAGRRYNPDTKDWEFPDSADTAHRLMMMLEPVVDAEVTQLVREHYVELSESIITAIGDDARLEHPALNFILYPYQRAYGEWSMQHPHNILADEMGIGKTIQGIGAVWEAKARAENGSPGPLDKETAKLPALIVTPNGLRRSYRDELVKGPRDEDQVPIYPDHWPSAVVQILDGANQGKRRKQMASDAEFFIINWEKLRTDAALLERMQFSAILGSEAHRAKNRDAQQTKGFWKLTAPIQIAETGTPVMNTPAELWSLLRWLLPAQYAARSPGGGGGYWPWHYTYVDDYPSKHGRVMRGIKNVDELRFELADKLARRTKKQVMPDLPDKLPPKHVAVDFKPAERKLYDEAEEALFLDIKAFCKAEGLARHNADTSLDPDEEAAKLADELADMPLARIEGKIKGAGARITALRQITAQAKARAAFEQIMEQPDYPVVTFTWFVPPAKWLAEQLEAALPDYSVGVIAGKGGDATETAQAFQKGEHQQIVCTIAKGGQGLDLYRASTALMADRDWVPAMNHQAVDRLHRKGQKNAVSTVIYYVPDTVDDGKIAPANRFKQGITDQLYGAP